MATAETVDSAALKVYNAAIAPLLKGVWVAITQPTPQMVGKVVRVVSMAARNLGGQDDPYLVGKVGTDWNGVPLEEPFPLIGGDSKIQAVRIGLVTDLPRKSKPGSPSKERTIGGGRVVWEMLT